MSSQGLCDGVQDGMLLWRTNVPGQPCKAKHKAAQGALMPAGLASYHVLHSEGVPGVAVTGDAASEGKQGRGRQVQQEA